MFDILNKSSEKIICNIGIIGYNEDEIIKRGLNIENNLSLHCLYIYPNDGLQGHRRHNSRLCNQRPELADQILASELVYITKGSRMPTVTVCTVSAKNWTHSAKPTEQVAGVPSMTSIVLPSTVVNGGRTTTAMQPNRAW